MFFYLVLFFLTNILSNLVTIGYLISTDTDIIILTFLISEIFYLLSFYTLILLLEVFEKNIEFSMPQTIMTMLIFVIIGLIFSNPEISVENRGGVNVASFSDDSLILLLEFIIYLIAGIWLLIILTRSRKGVKSQKQNALALYHF